MSHNILEQVGTARGALGRARCTTPQFGPLGGPASRPKRANFKATVRGRKCGSRKDHYSPGQPHDRHISHAKDGAGSEASPHGRTSLLASHGVRQTGPSAIYVSMHYISRTRSWVKPTIWLPSPPMGLTIHTGAQLHGEPRGIC